MPTQCVNLARASRMRLTRLDACGDPDPGPNSTLVTDGFINVDGTFNYLDPEEITQFNANGELCIDDQGIPQLRWIDLSIFFCRVDPDAVNIITGNPLVVDDDTPTNTVGYRVNSALTGTANFAMELWSGVTGQPCTAEGAASYGYWLFPYVVQARFGDFSIANAALTLNFTARTHGDSLWGTGPASYLVRADATTGTPEVLLSPIDDDDHMHFEVVTVPPPAAACGGTTLAA